MKTHTVTEDIIDGKRFLETIAVPEGGGFAKATFTIDDVEMDQNQWQRQMSSSIIKQLREELEQTSTASWADIQAWIDRATPRVRHFFPDRLSEFQSIAEKPPTLQTDALWPGGTKEEFAKFTEVTRTAHNASNAANNDTAKQQILTFLSRL